MKNAPWNKQDVTEFVSSSLHYRQRVERCLTLLLWAAIMLPVGGYLIISEPLDSASNRADITMQGTPALFGAATLVFGLCGLIPSMRGMRRKEKDAIDLKLGSKGITVRGGHTIPWSAITAITDIRYINEATIALLWDRYYLHRALEIRLDETLEFSADKPHDIPRLRIKDGTVRLRIPLSYYPAVDYQDLYDAVIAEFKRRGIPVETKRKHKQA